MTAAVLRIKHNKASPHALERLSVHARGNLVAFMLVSVGLLRDV